MGYFLLMVVVKNGTLAVIVFMNFIIRLTILRKLDSLPKGIELCFKLMP